ncbi:uncharacterized protein MONOS_2695 [Monocercomonoides exilis]|uniref:uncharacterized protein n=1 Tax=Monocercomonoides exilis TaxID=2049356 RepID=UPI00355A537B|nr:hypothetical protein MONOS_2695 [Monocercomonoides exilis]|eukprot:MONOS_2695.1-p1 / transcript=MONOS_2695.1 / gene=MONOS_2695 / organism=Monocercomonoides_exilis_PA203 / gene_product=unspecified product / transcript_product=unspecified product / location=Mono_scaffold00056:160249-161839(+) / protein_length=412 / sequence_SO=supercontig / SO=protein_coding / is_pseudo=false
MFTLQNRYETEVVKCTFQTLVSEGCKKGGAISFELKGADGQLKMSNEGVTDSICSSSEGCGVGIYLTYLTDNNDRYSLEEIIVGRNRVHLGRDVFIAVNYLKNEGISLDKLLFEHTDTSVVVSSSGRDIRGCGSETEPYEWDLSNSSISPAVPSSPGHSSSSSSSDEPSSDECTINVGKAIQSLSEPSEAVLTNKLMLTFTSINFCLPSSFETAQKELLFTETGTATLNKCSFAMQTAEEGIAFVLFHVSSGTLSIEESKMAELSFAASAIRLAAPAEHFVTSVFYVRMKEKADGGGAIALNCLDDPEDSDAQSSENAKVLPIKFRLIRFSLNRASVAKDLYIICRSIAEQINEALFVMDFNELAFCRNYAIFGIDKAHNEPIDLVPFIVFYKSERIFVLGEKWKNEKDCG